MQVYKWGDIAMMKKLKHFVVGLGFLALTGCSATYYLEGVKYENAQAFQAAVNDFNSQYLAAVIPLPEPLTEKELLFVVPSQQAQYQESVRRHIAAEGSVGELAKEQYMNLAIHGTKGAKANKEAISKRGVYKNVRLLETQSLVNDVAPTAEYDVLLYSEPSIGTGQWFYSSAKHGKQVFVEDRSGITPEQKVKNYLDAVQMMAIRE